MDYNNLSVNLIKQKITIDFQSVLFWNTVYCSPLITPKNNDRLIATFKIKRCHDTYIGIECGELRSANTLFCDSTANPNGEYYAYCSNGTKSSHNGNNKKYSNRYGAGDTIYMKIKFGAKYGKLYFKKNNSYYHDTQYKIKKNKNIKIAVGARESFIELLSLTKESDKVDNIGNDEKKEETSDGAVTASVVILYRYENSNAIDLGKKGAAIVQNTDNNNNSFCLICYEIKNREILFSIAIHDNFIVNVLKNHFIGFYDSKSNYFSMRFPNDNLLQTFVTGIVMCKIPKIIQFNHNNDIIIQDLNKVSDSNQQSTSTSIINTNLQIWHCDIKKHPFQKGEIIFNSEKLINLNSDKMLPALSKGLKSIKLNAKRLIILSAHYGFGQKGNKALNIPPNSPLIIQITVKSIKTPNDGDNNHDEKKKDRNKNNENNKNTKNINLNKMMNELQSELSNKIDIIKELKNDNNLKAYHLSETKQANIRQQTMIKHLQSEVEKYKKNIDELLLKQESEKQEFRNTQLRLNNEKINQTIQANYRQQETINNLQSQLEEYKQANRRQQETVKRLQFDAETNKKNFNHSLQEQSQTEEKQKNDIFGEEIGDDLKLLREQLRNFSNIYNKNKILSVFDVSPASLLVHDEIDGLDLDLRGFLKYLVDIKGYMISLTIPDIHKYTEWNIDDMIQWISLLENGRYSKYLNVLRLGFVSDGIDSGQCLPDLDKKDLRVSPFNMSDFKDRRDLANQFQALKSHQVINNNDINEGSGFTEYHHR